MKLSKKLVFFGSGPLASETLEFILRYFEVAAVITKPQPSHGHKSTPPVIKLAKNYGLNLFTPANKAELSELFSSAALPNTVGVVVDYGLIIPTDVIDFFEKGIVNSHFSLLPLWRGADPITFPLLGGDEVTGVSLMLIVAAMDEGDLIAQSSVKISKSDDAISLTSKLIKLSNQMLVETLPKYLSEQIDPWPQDPSVKATYSRKLTKADGQLDWNKPARQLEREIRAYRIWPKSYTHFMDMDVVITRAYVEHTDIDKAKPGQVECLKDIGQLLVYCGEGCLRVDYLIPAGKKEMSVRDFINGYCK